MESEGGSSPAPPKYYCHICKKEIQPLPEMVCPLCQSDFVEELEDEPAPAPPIAAPAQAPFVAPPFLFPVPNIPANGQPTQLLPFAQALRQLSNVIRMQTNNNGTITFQSGPIHMHTTTQPVAQPAAQLAQPSMQGPLPQNFVPTQNYNPFVFNAFNTFFPNLNFGTPVVGNPGDYVFGGNFEAILNQLFQNANHTGAPPAAKTAVDDLKKGQIDATQAEQKLDCAICKEELIIGSEYIEMPCKHIFDKECILQWLGIHNSCPVCRHELKTDNPDYEARPRR